MDRRRGFFCLRNRQGIKAMHNASDWISEWFAKNTQAYGDIWQEPDANYFEKGWMDSLLFITLMTDIESEFKITFDAEALYDPGFLTLSGLARIIEEKL